MLQKVDTTSSRERRPVPGADSAPGRRVSDERQVLVAGFALAVAQAQDIEGLLAEACRLCRQTLPLSSFTVLQHSPGGGSDLIRINIECSPIRDAAAGSRVDGLDGAASAASLSIPGDCRPYGVLRVGLPGGCALAASDLAFLAVVAELLGAAVIRLDHDETVRQAHVPEAAPATAQRELLGKLQHRIRDDLQVLHGFAHLRARLAPGLGRDAEFGAVSRRLASLAALYDNLRDGEGGLLKAGLERQVEFGDYLRNLCTRIEAAQGLAGRGIRLDAELCSLPMDLDAAAGLGVAVDELVSGAADYAFGGRGGRILVRLRPAADGHGRATLLVADDGGNAEDAPDGSDGMAYVHHLVARAGARIERQDSVGTGWRIDLR